MGSDSEGRSDQVTLPRWALVALVLAALLSSLGVAFMLGRESARPLAAPALPERLEAAGPGREQPRELEAPRVPPRPLRSQAPAPVVEAPALPAPEAPRAPARAPASAPAGAAPSPAAPPPAPVDPVEKEKVARYFRALEDSVGAASAWQNPDVLANTVLSQGAQGDGSGFDMVLEANRRALARVRAVKPPEPCRRHHQLTMQLMDSGIRLLKQLRQATLSGDPGPLMALATEGQALQGKIEELDRLGREIRQQYGL